MIGEAWLSLLVTDPRTQGLRCPNSKNKTGFSSSEKISAAIAALTKAQTAGDSGLVLLRNDPMFDNIKNEPAFQKLRAALGFE